MSQQQSQSPLSSLPGTGVRFSVVRAGGEVLEREICSAEPEGAARYFEAHRDGRGLVALAWRYGPLHAWQAGTGGAWVPQPLLCPEFRRVQGLAYRRLAGWFAGLGMEFKVAANRLGRLCGYYPDVDAGVKSIVEHEIASALPGLLRFLDVRAIVRDLLHARAIEVLTLPREVGVAEEELPPGVFVLRS